MQVTFQEIVAVGNEQSYQDIGKLEAATEEYEDAVNECENDNEAAFSALVWIGKLLKAVLGKL